MKDKLAIIGASLFQRPLILKAKQLGFETHVFAWEQGAVAAKFADFFYPISVTDFDKIIIELKKIQPKGIVSIASDLTAITVAKLAEIMNLPSNPLSVIQTGTNKYQSRLLFEQAGLANPRFRLINSNDDIHFIQKNFVFPIIVKPTDRSGSRGIVRVEKPELLEEAVTISQEQSFTQQVIVEEFFEGQEFSLEFLSINGKHYCLAITEKETTGFPHYIETAHIQPSGLSPDIQDRMIQTVSKALDALGYKNGATHPELKVNDTGKICIIEIGPRMGGDFIGSDLVQLSTGYDFVKAVIDGSIGQTPEIPKNLNTKSSGVRFFFAKPGKVINIISQPKNIRGIFDWELNMKVGDMIHPITQSAERLGYILLQANNRSELIEYMQMVHDNFIIETSAV